MIDFRENALREHDAVLARRFESEIVEAAGQGPRTVCRIEAEGPDPAAPDRARIVLLQSDTVTEWTVALPAASGDVARAARRALAGRRQLSARRRPARQGLDRRR